MYIRKVKVVEERIEVWKSYGNKTQYIERGGKCQRSILLKSDRTEIEGFRPLTDVEQALYASALSTDDE